MGLENAFITEEFWASRSLEERERRQAWAFALINERYPEIANAAIHAAVTTFDMMQSDTVGVFDDYLKEFGVT